MAEPDFVLDPPTEDDLGPLHRISADPRVWTHYPSLRHARGEQTAVMLETWMLDWQTVGLGAWVVRAAGDSWDAELPAGSVIGYGGCSLRGGGLFWNLGYRFLPEAQGRGIATEVSRQAIRAARTADPDRPIVAYLVEHNLASARVAIKVGLELRHRAPDGGNPDPTVQRLVYADRPLSADELEASLD